VALRAFDRYLCGHVSACVLPDPPDLDQGQEAGCAGRHVDHRMVTAAQAPPMGLHNMRKLVVPTIAVMVALTYLSVVRAETPDEWIKLSDRVHGVFGSLTPVGIRIGLDALERLNAQPGELTVTYYDSDKAPCACVADGVGLATLTTVGRRTLQIASEKAPEGTIAVVVVQKKQSGEAIRYTVPDAWLPKLEEWNRTLDEAGRYEAVMAAEGLIKVRVLTKQSTSRTPRNATNAGQQKRPVKSNW
jgi:formylmethanofuran dehydrogenase subunit E